MTFSTALNLLKKNEKLARKGWNGKGQWVGLADMLFETHESFLILKNASGKYVPWVPSTGDLFATDWEVVE